MNGNLIIYIVRHAEARGNYDRIFHGHTDGEITERGHRQAELVARRLADVHFDEIYSSDLKRTIQTAGYINRGRGLEILKKKNLREINGGDWEGKAWDELPVIWPLEYDTWENNMHLHKMPNGESMDEFSERIYNEFKKIADESKGKQILLVIHGTAIKALMCRLHNLEPDGICNIPWQDNTAVSIIEYKKPEFIIKTEGDATHLDAESSTFQNQQWWTEYIKKTMEEEKI